MTAIAVIVPALNEAGNIGRLVAEVLATLPVQVIVVDNGSSDATAQEARAAGARVVAEPRRGYGYACAAGVAAARDADVLAFLDGDYSFLPSELPVVLAPLLAGEADLVLGSRWLGHIAPGAMPFQQRFGNWLAARLMNRLYGLAVTDLGPYRAIRRPLLVALDMREMTYGWPTEMMVKAAKRGARLVEVPVSFHRRQAGRSKVSGTLRGTLLAAWYILGVTLRYAWTRPKP
jgi:glycosyltransferase involved in cell wall biosynthesis